MTGITLAYPPRLNGTYMIMVTIWQNTRRMVFLATQNRAKTVLPKNERFPRTYALALRMGVGETMWFPRKMFLHTFCAKKYGPVAARATRYLPAKAAVRLLQFYIDIGTNAFSSSPFAPQNRSKTFLLPGCAFPAHPGPRPTDGAWGKPCGFPEKCFCILFAPKSMGRSRPERQAVSLPERLHVCRVLISH